jgi:hypothetical protein
MIKRMVEASPQAKARMAGAFQLLEALAATFGQVVVLSRLVVVGSAAATAANILGHESLYWLGFASSVIGVLFHVAWIFLFYELFKPVSRGLSLLAVGVGIMVCAMQALASLFYLAPLVILEAGNSLGAVSTEQVQALSAIFLKLNTYAFDIDLVFFGCWCVLTGFLIFRSGFLPRILGVLLIIDGLGWVTYLYPPYAAQIFPFIAVASGLAEIPLELWLMVKGVNVQRWKEMAGS